MKKERNGIIPNFFIVGAARCGTTSLYNYLKQHPEIYMSPIKEPNYFCKDIKSSNFLTPFRRHSNFNYKAYLNGAMKNEVQLAWIKEEEEYLKLYRNVKNEKAIGEASTVYLYSMVSSKEIYKFNPNAKIIIVLRNPVDRAFSHYLIDYNSKVTNDKLISLIEKGVDKKSEWGRKCLCIEPSLYYEQIQRFLAIFPEENIKFLFFEDLKNNSEKVIKDLYSFLEVDTEFMPNIRRKYNSSIKLTPKSKHLKWVSSRMNLYSIYKKIPEGTLKNVIERSYYKKKVNPTLSDFERGVLRELFKDDIDKLRMIVKNIPNDY